MFFVDSLFKGHHHKTASYAKISSDPPGSGSSGSDSMISSKMSLSSDEDYSAADLEEDDDDVWDEDDNQLEYDMWEGQIHLSGSSTSSAGNLDSCWTPRKKMEWRNSPLMSVSRDEVSKNIKAILGELNTLDSLLREIPDEVPRRQRMLRQSSLPIRPASRNPRLSLGNFRELTRLEEGDDVRNKKNHDFCMCVPRARKHTKTL